MRNLWLVVALCVATTATAKRPPRRAMPVGQALVKKLADVEQDRLHAFATVLGNVAGFPGSAPHHKSELVAFQKELAQGIGVPAVQLDVVANAMVGDEKDPPVSTITFQLTEEQLQDALDAIQSQHGAQTRQSPDGKVTTLGRIALNETRKTLSWGWLRPPVSRPDWDTASSDAMRKTMLAIVRDAGLSTLVKFVEDLKKRTTHRNEVYWDDERASYSFNVTDSGKFLTIDFDKPFPAGAFLKELGITDVTFTNPCDADYLSILNARSEVITYGKWSLTLRTTHSEDYHGAVQYCTSHNPVKAVPAAKITIRSAKFNWEGK